ncbi:hypothetical protein [Achromobacter xylosoxidans]|uniref:hypothetical protein n=1 Tax=Alcaligenes xylosoxydans xylosoxydans TaxID=85698 RepID=UPI0012DDC326|nr:hypothetical protein [Achromobacter xylosoxidans]
MALELVGWAFILGVGFLICRSISRASKAAQIKQSLDSDYAAALANGDGAQVINRIRELERVGKSNTESAFIALNEWKEGRQTAAVAQELRSITELIEASERQGASREEAVALALKKWNEKP